ncbi:MAG: FHA domain-containing protein [Akkermansiaceae bacterium]|nr:FHA domain-containing protein [Akkermansiaceae bacterium]
MPRITVTVPDKVSQPYRFSLERQIVHFGRGDDNDVILDSGSVSSEHAVMERTIGGYVLKDLGSTNGIKLNGERLETIKLRNGQDIQIGDVDFDFLLSDEEMTALRLEDPTASLPPLDKDPTARQPTSPEAKTSPEIELKDEPAAGGIDLMSDPDAKPEDEAPSQPGPPSQPPAKKELPPQPEPQQAAPQELPQQQAPQQQSEPPAPQQSPQDPVAPQASEKPKEEFSLSNVQVAILAVLAFLIGLAMHFQGATDQSFIGNLIKKLAGG